MGRVIIFRNSYRSSCHEFVEVCDKKFCIERSGMIVVYSGTFVSRKMAMVVVIAVMTYQH